MIDGINDLLTHDGFRTGLLFGLAASAGAALGALVSGRLRPWAGVAFGAAVVLALADRFTVEVRFVVGLAVLGVGGALASRAGPALRVAAALPGAVVFAGSSELDHPEWARATVLVATVVGGALVAEFDRAYARRGLAPVLLAVTVLGVYTTTPDTEHAMILAGVALPVALLGWPRPLASLGAGGSFVVVAVVSWTAVVDGAGRSGAVVGALACLGLLVIEPAVRRARRARRPEGAPVASAALVAALHVGVVAVCSRVAGLRDPAPDALVISAVAFAVAAGVLVGVAGRATADPPPRHHRG